jgi:AmmeMemoRadiSam system protein A
MPADSPSQPFPPDAGRILLPLARIAIASELKLEPPKTGDDSPWLKQPGASFITLMRQNQLRGCIGTLQAHRTLLDDVRANAVGAAFRDPRFTPLTAAEYAGISVEVSVLSPLETMQTGNEADALKQLRPGIDGLVFEYGRHRSTFLPQVWEKFPQPADFMAQLKYKAGLPPDFWDKDARLSRYTVFKWREES